MKVLALLLLVIMTACATVNSKTVDSDGSTCEASYTSVLKTTSGIKMSACHAKGEMSSSTVDPAGGDLLDRLIERAVRR